MIITPTDSAGAWHSYFGGRSDGWDAGAGSASYYYENFGGAYRNHHFAYLGGALPLLGPGVNVLSATLYVDVTGASNFGGGIGAARLLGVGNQSAGTFRAQDAGGAGDQVNIVVSTLGWQGFDLTSAVQWDYAHSYTYGGFLFSANGSGVGSSSFSFVPYFAASGNNPYIVVQTDAPETTPEPASELLLGGALLGCYLLLRKRAVG